MSIDKTVFEILELLRNGAGVCGDHAVSNQFRQKCIEHAYHEACLVLVPLLVNANVIKTSVKLENLVDIGPMLQKFVIRPELTGVAPLYD